MIWALSFILAGAVARHIDGSRNGGGIPTLVRNLIMIAIATGAAWWGGCGWWAFFVGPVAALNLIVGYTDWEDLAYMPFRYAVPAGIAVAPLWLLGGEPWLYVLGCFLAGLACPILMRLDPPHVRRRMILGRVIDFQIDGPEAYARILAGGWMLGGLSMLESLSSIIG